MDVSLNHFLMITFFQKFKLNFFICQNFLMKKIFKCLQKRNFSKIIPTKFTELLLSKLKTDRGALSKSITLGLF
jgi:hypothetical protein